MCCRTSVAKGRYTIPITNRDPGPDGRLGTGDDTGKLVHLLRVPHELGGRLVRENDVHQQRGRGFEVQVLRGRVHETAVPGMAARAGRTRPPGWTFRFSAAPAGTGLGSGNPLIWYPTRCATNPNQAFNTANNTREWQAKMSGAYNLPYGILASANYDIRSGLKQARQVQFTGGTTIRSIKLNVEPIGSTNLPNTHELDVRLAKRVNLEVRCTLGGAACGHLQCAEQGDGQGSEPAVGRELPAPLAHHVPAHHPARRHVDLLASSVRSPVRPHNGRAASGGAPIAFSAGHI